MPSKEITIIVHNNGLNPVHADFAIANTTDFSNPPSITVPRGSSRSVKSVFTLPADALDGDPNAFATSLRTTLTDTITMQQRVITSPVAVTTASGAVQISSFDLGSKDVLTQTGTYTGTMTVTNDKADAVTITSVTKRTGGSAYIALDSLSLPLVIAGKSSADITATVTIAGDMPQTQQTAIFDVLYTLGGSEFAGFASGTVLPLEVHIKGPVTTNGPVNFGTLDYDNVAGTEIHITFTNQDADDTATILSLTRTAGDAVLNTELSRLK